MPPENTESIDTVKIDSELTAFSALAQASEAKARNVANEPELRVWLDEIIGEAAPMEDWRAEKMRVWMSSVARRWLLKNGQGETRSPKKEELLEAPAWVRAEVDSGTSLF